MFNKLAIRDPHNLIFGTAPSPVTTRRGLNIGGGTVYPELNFTLSSMEINDSTFEDIKKQYAQIATDALERARQLESPGLVLEFEALLEMTLEPRYGVELVKVMNDICEENYTHHGFKSELRLTPNDLRDYERPPKMRSSAYLDTMMELFEDGAKNGGDLLSIESTGGKEVFDDALMMCDTRGMVFALAVLGVRDMQFLWQRITEIARRTDVVPGGDTACGFANTAMVMAEKGYIPAVFSALVRVVSVVRTLVAVEQGALGPDKDCGYEGPYLKAIAGIPISMEGRMSAGAHLSRVGNVAGACADLWSNESIQNIKLLSGMAPTAALEQLEYDARLFNRALMAGGSTALDYQHLLIESDIHLDPQALILAPEPVVTIAAEMVQSQTHLQAAVRGGLKALDVIESAIETGELSVPERETAWIDRMREELHQIPDDESQFIEQMMPMLEAAKWIPEEYGL